MTLDPFLSAPPVIQLHAVSAMLALGLGPVALYRRRRDRVHKTVGYAWMSAMVIAALSSFFITGFRVIGPFSPIHILSVLALWSVQAALRAAIAGRIREHRDILGNLFWRGLIIAGLFTFLPGRLLNRMIFGDFEQLGWVVIGAGSLVILADMVRRRAGVQDSAKGVKFYP